MNETGRKIIWQTSDYEKPLVTARYFGFEPINAPKITPADVEAVAHCEKHPHYDAVEKAALIRTYINDDWASLPHPLAIAYKRKKNAGYSLHYLGAASAIAEAALMRAALSILSDEGAKNLRVDFNCIGDKDTQSIYERELGNHFKKFGHTLPEGLRERFKTNIFSLFTATEEEAIEFRSSAPSALNFLSSPMRNHFKEVLEFVEGLSIEFGLAPELIGERNHSSHTVFGIRLNGEDAEKSSDPNKFLAVGYRYNRLGKKLGLRREIPMAGITIFSSESEEPKIYKDLPKPKFYIIQLGQPAKIKTLRIIEDLRRERIPIGHLLGKDKLSVQMEGAENSKVSHLIIIGHKEALDNTATIRNVATRAQDTIPLEHLPQYLKKVKL